MSSSLLSKCREKWPIGGQYSGRMTSIDQSESSAGEMNLVDLISTVLGLLDAKLTFNLWSSPKISRSNTRGVRVYWKFKWDSLECLVPLRGSGVYDASSVITSLWLVNTEHVTWILASDWSILMNMMFQVFEAEIDNFNSLTLHPKFPKDSHPAFMSIGLFCLSCAILLIGLNIYQKYRGKHRDKLTT